MSEVDAANAVDVFENSGTVTFFQGHLHDLDCVSLDDTLQMFPQASS